MGKSAEEILKNVLGERNYNALPESIILLIMVGMHDYAAQFKPLPVDGYREALAELVRLKDIKDELDVESVNLIKERMDSPRHNENKNRQHKNKLDDYISAKKIAWQKAKEVLSSPNKEQK